MVLSLDIFPPIPAARLVLLTLPAVALGITYDLLMDVTVKAGWGIGGLIYPSHRAKHTMGVA